MFGRLSGLWAALALIAGLQSGCSSTQDVLGSATYGLDGNTVNATGTYPSLGTPLEAAGEQLSDEEAAAMGSELEALAQARKGGTVSDAAYRQRLAQLRKLAREHSEDAAADIEN